MVTNVQLVLASLTLLPFIVPYKILSYSPQFSLSHVKFAGNIADFLVQAGHNVTILMPKASPTVNITGTKYAKVIFIPAAEETAKTSSTILPLTLQKGNSFQRSKDLEKAFATNCKKILEQEQLLEVLKNEKFDVLLTELFDACAFVLKIPAHIINCASSLMDNVASLVGVPLFPSYVPSTLSSFTDQMSYMERFVNLVMTETSKYFFNRILFAEEKLFKEHYGEHFPDLRFFILKSKIFLQDVIAQTTFVLTNAEPLIDFPRPVTHKVVEIAGLSYPQVKPLNEVHLLLFYKEWEKILSTRNKAVLVSFGSNIQSCDMPGSLKKIFLDLFLSFPDVTFIWKYEVDDLPLDKYKNLVTSKWLPQNDILGESFVTHGGMNSIVETISIGKPMVVVPIFGDQFRNGKMIERYGTGLVVSRYDDGGRLFQALKEILDNKSVSAFPNIAQKLAKMIRKKPTSSKMLLIKHVEFAAEFGRLPLWDPVGRTMPFYKLYLLDILIPLILVLLSLSAALFFSLYKVIRKLFSTGRKAKSE
ncbi:unnamed protein product [Enterobius vermicularis]|uniref:glucuronosyltransferase n=1 Tax=Enterobius vermicularis TaxID=51028 RepID=A0A0N4VBC3_ENTVE|nr:unnamed protein product [Enterobius vermicularis]